MLRNLGVRNWVKNNHFYRENFLILKDIKYIWPLIVKGIGLSIGASLLEGVGIGLLLNLLRGLTGEGGNVITGWVVVDVWLLGINDTPREQVIRASIVIIITTLIRGSLTYSGSRNLIKAQINFVERLRIRIFDQLLKMQLSYYRKARSGDLVTVLMAEVNQLRNAASALSQLLSRGIYLPVYLIIGAVISIQLVVTALLLLLVLPTVLIWIRRKVRRSSINVTKANKALASLVVEFLSGIQVIQMFAAESFERKRFVQRVDDTSFAFNQLNRWVAATEPIAQFFGVAVMLSMVVLGYVVYQIQLSSLLAFMYIMLRVVQIIKTLNISIVGLSQVHGSVNSIKQILSDKGKPYFINGNIPFSGLEKHIEFRSVDFSYDKNRSILHDVNLEISKGQKVAFVGSSGSGKSTLISLLMRLYDPTKGKILIDDIDISHYEIESLRRKMAVVSQDTFLFNASVEDNIAYGMEDISKLSIIRAAETAYAIDFIEELPNGFNTILGERGVRLSGGQRQRLAIARAILRNPDILILDEATSALDNISERLVQEAINSVSLCRTVLTIAHRLSTIVDADVIYVLSNGSLVEKGTYQELMGSAEGIFRKMSVSLT